MSNLAPPHIALADEYIDHARGCEVYHVRAPSELVGLFRAAAPALDLLRGLPRMHRAHRQHCCDVRFYSDDVPCCRYLDKVISSATMPPALADAVTALSNHLGVVLNGALVSRYSNGDDHSVPHSDAVEEYIPQPSVAVSVAGDAAPLRAIPRYSGCPYIVTLSLGATRAFNLIDKATGDVAISYRLGDGDIIIMAGHTQDHYLHTAPVEPMVRTERYSFTLCNHADHGELAPSPSTTPDTTALSSADDKSPRTVWS